MYRLTTVYDRGLVMTQDTAALCNMSLSSAAMSPGSPAPEVRAEVNREEEEEETKEITLNRESMLVNISAIYTNFHLKKSCLSARRYITFLFQDDLHVEKLYPVRKRYLGFLNLKRWEIFYYLRQNRILQDYSRKFCLHSRQKNEPKHKSLRVSSDPEIRSFHLSLRNDFLYVMT